MNKHDIQMDLYGVLAECTQAYRKGASVTTETSEGGIDVAHVYAMPPTDVIPDAIEKVDVHFFVCGVNRQLAESHRGDVLAWIDAYPSPERFAKGLSYIEVGAELGDQESALRLFAIGQVLGLWKVITPATLGFEGSEADAIAGRGLVMIDGYKPC